MIWVSSPDLALDPFVAGQNGVSGFVLKTRGLTKVVQSGEGWPSVRWETIAIDDLDDIIIAPMHQRRFADDYQVKLEYQAANHVTNQMSVVKADRNFIVSAHQIHAGLRIPSATKPLLQASPRTPVHNPDHGRSRPHPARVIQPVVATLRAGAWLFGEENLHPPEMFWKTHANRLFGATYELLPIHDGIVWKYHLTRTIVAATCRAVFAVWGLRCGADGIGCGLAGAAAQCDVRRRHSGKLQRSLNRRSADHGDGDRRNKSFQRTDLFRDRAIGQCGTGGLGCVVSRAHSNEHSKSRCGECHKFKPLCASSAQ